MYFYLILLLVLVLIVYKFLHFVLILVRPFQFVPRSLYGSLSSLHAFDVVFFAFLPFSGQFQLPLPVSNLGVVVDYGNSLDARYELLEVKVFAVD